MHLPPPPPLLEFFNRLNVQRPWPVREGAAVGRGDRGLYWHHCGGGTGRVEGGGVDERLVVAGGGGLGAGDGHGGGAAGLKKGENRSSFNSHA